MRGHGRVDVVVHPVAADVVLVVVVDAETPVADTNRKTPASEIATPRTAALTTVILLETLPGGHGTTRLDSDANRTADFSPPGTVQFSETPGRIQRWAGPFPLDRDTSESLRNWDTSESLQNWDASESGVASSDRTAFYLPGTPGFARQGAR